MYLPLVSLKLLGGSMKDYFLESSKNLQRRLFRALIKMFVTFNTKMFHKKICCYDRKR
jgi:hypothetical protein